jgi:hypothetical protein
MRPTFLGTGLVMLVVLGRAPAADTDPKAIARSDTGRRNDLVLEFHDGDKVRLISVAGNLEVATRFGKLTVPIDTIQTVEFGLHTPEEIAATIENCIRDLDSDAFRAREEAGKRLVELGRFAYPALLKAAKGNSLEKKRRIEALLRTMQGRYPEYQLKMRSEDTIKTTDFTIVGQITQPILKVRTHHFGEGQFSLSDLYRLKRQGQVVNLTVAVDGSQYALPDDQWLATGFIIGADTQIRITAEGQVDLETDSPGQFVSDPDGNRANPLLGGRAGGHPPGKLLGRIGENGPVFAIGKSFEAVPTNQGKLYLRIQPWPGTGGAKGSYTVKLTGTPR